ncbi:MAG: hypothetical protein SPI94_04590 [Candidatus Onthovivens sp.]|nr:hypothetical protein [Candidatus Onthovivens sp.]
MIANLDVLRKEITKLQNTLGETQPKNYKRYATIFNSYLTAVASFNQTEAILRNQEAERKRQEEIEKAQKEAEEELKAEEQKTQTSKGSRRNIIKPVDCPNSDEQANKIDKMLQEMQEEK